MNIGFITKQDPEDIKAYSGTHYAMYRALQSQFEEVERLGPLTSGFSLLPRLYGRALRLLTGKVYKYQYNIGLAKRVAEVIDSRIANLKPDVLVASQVSPEVGFLKSNKPLYITTDATFPLLQDVYRSHSNLHPQSVKAALYLERIAFKKATKLILPLSWLADSAMRDYGISSSKIEVIPYGSNLGIDLSYNEVEKLIEARMASPKITLLFVGVRWEEKGGPFAVQVTEELRKLGVDADLVIAGCEPDIKNTEWIKKVGFLDKSKADENEILLDLYRKATFFIMPTKAECVGMSFIEAASLGLPAIGTEVGGVPEAVTHKNSGYIINKEQTAKEVARWVKTLLQKEKKSQKSFTKV